MDVQKVTHEIKLQEWSGIVKECRSSGKPIVSWCEEKGINIKTYYYWQKRVYQATCEDLTICQSEKAHGSPVFAELGVQKSNPGKLAVTLRHNNAEVEIYSGADRETVETVLQALRKLC